MTDSLFDDESSDFLILLNDEQQYSIWPQPLPVPSGWRVVEGPMPRQHCMTWLKNNWKDLRPQSLRQQDQPQDQEHLA